MGQTELLTAATRVSAAYAGSHALAAEALPHLIKAVHDAFQNLESAPEAEQGIKQPSAVQIRKSIQPDLLISFEDGRPYRLLKRHLKMRRLTFGQYKHKWGLPDDYPSVAPSYSAYRSDQAKAAGLGRHGRSTSK